MPNYAKNKFFKIGILAQMSKRHLALIVSDIETKVDLPL